jgi:hypothetical protein
LLTGKSGKPVNAELADSAAKIVTIRGRETARDGFAQLQVDEIRKFCWRSAPEFARGRSDFSILIRQSVLAITGEEEWAVKINPVRRAGQKASGRDP